MNKYQEALNKLKIMGDKDLYNEKHIEWTNTLQELVDKATPKKRIYIGATPSILSHFICPVCKTKVSPIGIYCAECGQRLE